MISLRFWQTQGHLAILKPHSRKDAPLPQMLHPGQLSKVPTGQADFGEATWASEWFSQGPYVESDGWTESLKNRQNICAIFSLPPNFLIENSSNVLYDSELWTINYIIFFQLLPKF